MQSVRVGEPVSEVPHTLMTRQLERDAMKRMTVGQVAEVAREAGVRPSVLIDRILGALEDEARRDAQFGADVGQ